MSSIHPATIHGTSNGRQVPVSAMPTTLQRGHHVSLSYSAIQFNHEKYAAMYSTPFTPDPSLMKPANMSEWTPSTTTPLDTPFGGHQIDSAVSIDSGWFSMTDTKQETKGKEILRPTAKVFIPTDTPLLKSNPQPQRNTLLSSIHAPHSQPPTFHKHQKTKSTERSSLIIPAQSLPLGGALVHFETPKAMTPLAAPSAGLPARPTLCAVAPNLPRWAHSPAHAMMSSIETRYIAMGDHASCREPSLLRRARASTVSHEERSSPRGTLQGTHSRNGSNGTIDQSDEAQMAMPSAAYNSGSRTPWALQKTAAELEIKGDAVPAAWQKSPSTGLANGTDQVASPTPISSAISSRGIQVNSISNVKAKGSFDGNSWRRQIQGSFARAPRKPSLTPSIPGGLLGAVPMHSVSIK